MLPVQFWHETFPPFLLLWHCCCVFLFIFYHWGAARAYPSLVRVKAGLHLDRLPTNNHSKCEQNGRNLTSTPEQTNREGADWHSPWGERWARGLCFRCQGVRGGPTVHGGRQRRDGLSKLSALIVREVARQTRLPLAHLSCYFCTQENNVLLLEGALRSASQRLLTIRTALLQLQNIWCLLDRKSCLAPWLCVYVYQGKLYGSVSWESIRVVWLKVHGSHGLRSFLPQNCL